MTVSPAWCLLISGERSGRVFTGSPSTEVIVSPAFSTSAAELRLLHLPVSSTPKQLTCWMVAGPQSIVTG